MKNAISDDAPASIAKNSGPSILINRWLGALIDFVVLLMFLCIPDLVLGNALYQKTLFIWLALCAGYFLVMESVFGKSVGKFITGIRVVNAQGGNPSWKQSAIRTLFRLVEVNPILLGGVPAGIAALVSKNRQRIGDMVAGTYVLRDRDISRMAFSGTA